VTLANQPNAPGAGACLSRHVFESPELVLVRSLGPSAARPRFPVQTHLTIACSGEEGLEVCRQEELKIRDTTISEVPPGRTERKCRHPLGAFVQVTATYSLD